MSLRCEDVIRVVPTFPLGETRDFRGRSDRRRQALEPFPAGSVSRDPPRYQVDYAER